MRQDSSRSSDNNKADNLSQGSQRAPQNTNTKHPKQATSVLKKWLIEHLQNPYLKPQEKAQLAEASGLTKRQVQNWFTNVRKVGHPVDTDRPNDLLSIYHQNSSDPHLLIESHRAHVAEVQGQEGSQANPTPDEAQD